MNIERSVVTKLTITGLPDLDPVHVFIDDMNANRGRVTITCFDESWSHYWGSIGSATITEFFCSCDEHYLAHKFATGIKDGIVDTDAIERDARAKVCKMRREDRMDKNKARDLFDEVRDADFYDLNSNSNLLYEVYGDEWWDCLPGKPNPDYEYLCRIVRTVKEAISTEMVKQ